MKYLLVPLLLLGSLLGRPTTVVPVPLRMAATAQFVQLAPGLQTTVTLYLNAGPRGTRLGIAIAQTRLPCDQAGCWTGPLLSGYTYRRGIPGEVLLDPDLRRASVHATMSFHDDPTQTALPLRLDAVWTASGPPQCAGPDDCVRVATVLGAVGQGSRPLLTAQRVPDGQLSMTRPPASSTGP